MIYLNLVILLLIGAGVWWLTGIDKTVSGEGKRDRHFFRALRCVAVVFLAWAFLWFIEQPDMGYGGIPFLIILPVSIALVLRSPLAEFFSGGFLRLLDPSLHDDRPLDPGKSRRYQDAIARLIQNGQRAEAIKLCEELKQSGEVDLVTLENTLEFLGVPQASAKTEPPLAQAARLRAQGKFAEAEQLLKSLLAKKPADSGAALLLLRLYAQDLRQPQKAHEFLRVWEKQPGASADHLEFARRSIAEWSRPQPQKSEPSAPPKPESVEELLAKGFYGSAVERLEAQAQSRPLDFDLRLKLAEVHAVHLKNLPRAEKIIRQMERNFSPQQIESARTRLAEWHAAASRMHRAA